MCREQVQVRICLQAAPASQELMRSYDERGVEFLR